MKQKNTIKKEEIHEPALLSEAYDYKKPSAFSRGMRVKAQDLDMLFISGTASVDKTGKSIHPGNFKAQCQRTFINLDGLLKSKGASWKDVVKTTVFIKDMKDYEEFNKIRCDFFRKKHISIFPASTCVQAKLCREELLIEIDAIAIASK